MAVTPLPIGAISMSSINIAFNRASNATISMNTGAIRCIANTDKSTLISMGPLRGKTVAGGTITANTATSTSKGVTTVSYGRVGSPAGTVTNGNLSTIFSTIQTPTAWNPFQSSKASNSAAYGAGMSILTNTTSSAGYVVNFRMKIGNDNITALFNYGTYVVTGASTGQAVYSLSTTTNSTFFITASDVGVAREWALCIA